MCADRSAGGSARVLVIEDEPSVADALRVILEDRGYAVVVATCGREGIEQARRAPFDLTVTDLRLPDIDGLSVISTFREGGLGGAIILITSHGTPEIFACAKDLGAADVISKPFLPSELLCLIAAVTGEGGAREPEG